MTSKLKLLGASAAMAVIVATSVPAMATTQSGTDILNTVNVSFQVGGVTQVAPPAATNTFKVDRKVLFTITEKTPVGTTAVSANQTGAVTAFTLSNTSNDTLDFTVTPANILTGGTTPRGTDAFDLSSLLICQSTNGTTCDAAAAASVTVDDLAKDTGTTTILIIGTIPGSATNGQIAGVTATATALNSNGTAITAATDATVNGAATVETVFADTGRDGIETASDDYTVAAAALTVLKTSRVVFDNINGPGTNADPTNPKSVPGATVEYCISIANASGAATASSLNISDVVPTNTTFVSGSIKRDVTVPDATATRTCTLGTTVTDAVGYTAGTTTVASAVNNIAGGSTSGLLFRVTIN